MTDCPINIIPPSSVMDKSLLSEPHTGATGIFDYSIKKYTKPDDVLKDKLYLGLGDLYPPFDVEGKADEDNTAPPLPILARAKFQEQADDFTININGSPVQVVLSSFLNRKIYDYIDIVIDPFIIYDDLKALRYWILPCTNSNGKYRFSRLLTQGVIYLSKNRSTNHWFTISLFDDAVTAVLDNIDTLTSLKNL